MWTLIMAAAVIAGGQHAAPGGVAWGDDPDWRIEAEAGGWALSMEGRPALRLVPGAWRDTPRGRRLTGTMGAGRFVLVATFGACGLSAPGGPRSSYFAHLTLSDGRILRGCMGAMAAGGYPG